MRSHSYFWKFGRPVGRFAVTFLIPEIRSFPVTLTLTFDHPNRLVSVAKTLLRLRRPRRFDAAAGRPRALRGRPGPPLAARPTCPQRPPAGVLRFPAFCGHAHAGRAGFVWSWVDLAPSRPPWPAFGCQAHLPSTASRGGIAVSRFCGRPWCRLTAAPPGAGRPASLGPAALTSP